MILTFVKGLSARLARGLLLTMLLCGLLAAAGADNASAEDWPVVLRPGINAGTGTADYNVSVFAPVYQTGSSMLFIAPNFRYNDGANQNEFNIGGGIRSLLSDEAFIGANIFYDEVRTRNSHNFHQIGLGLEGRGRWLDLMLNGHIPVGDTKEDVMDNSVTRTAGLTVLRAKGREEQLAGLDGEVGTLIPVISDYVETRAYLGGYYWLSDLVGDIEGVKARLELMPVPFVTVNASYSYDEQFESTWRGEVYLNIPFDLSGGDPFAGMADAFKFGQGARDTKTRMTDRIERDRYIIVVEGHGGFRAVRGGVPE